MDTSDVAIGALLSNSRMVHGNHWRSFVVYCAERKSNTALSNVNSCYSSCRSSFPLFFDAQCFVIFTDHKPLTFSKISDPCLVCSTAASSRSYIRIYHGYLPYCWKAELCGRHCDSSNFYFSSDPQVNINYQDMFAYQLVSEVSAYRTAITNFRLEDISNGNSN